MDARTVVAAPVAQQPLAVLDVPCVLGERVVTAAPVRYGYRAWSDVYEADGEPRVDLVCEVDYWDYVLNGTPPTKVTRWPARRAWIV